MSTCKTILSSMISPLFRNHTKNTIQKRNIAPNLVGFLANEDPAALKYAEWTTKSCEETGINFKLIKTDKESLEKKIVEANLNSDINGIMIYYPVFGDHSDLYLQNRIYPMKDVEGLGSMAVKNVYRNKRFIDDEKNVKSIIPCTPLAIIKILTYLDQYDNTLSIGYRLKGRNITIINRSEVVGKPLAALLANEGANVFSADKDNVQSFIKSDDNQHCVVIDTSLKCAQAVRKSDIVITGVPISNYKVPTRLLKPGVVAINFSAFANFDADVTTRASYFVPSVGKVTVAMLERNLLRLYDYQNNLKANLDGEHTRLTEQ